MRSQAFRSSGCWRWTILGPAVLVLLAATPARYRVSCKLLQPAELESTLKEWAAGGKAAKFSGSADNSGGIAFDTCRGGILRPGQGNLQITAVVVENLPVSAAADSLRSPMKAITFGSA